MTNDLKKEENFRLGILLAAAAAAAAAAEPGVESLGWKDERWRKQRIGRMNTDHVYGANVEQSDVFSPHQSFK